MHTVEIVEDAGIKLGLIRKTETLDFEVIMQDALDVETLPFDALTSRFGSKILEFKTHLEAEITNV